MERHVRPMAGALPNHPEEAGEEKHTKTWLDDLNDRLPAHASPLSRMSWPRDDEHFAPSCMASYVSRSQVTTD